MKTLIRICMLLALCAITVTGYSQSEWENANTTIFKWRSNSNVRTYSNTLTSLSFWNFHALSKENKKYNTWDGEYISMLLPASWSSRRPWKISFDISNVNNSPHTNKYRVYDDNNRAKWHKGHVYWGFQLKVSREIYEHIYCNCSHIGRVDSYNSNSKKWNWDGYSSKKKILIEGDGYNTIKVYEVNNSIPTLLHTFKDANCPSIISICASTAAYVKVENFKAQIQSIYGKVKPYITTANSNFKNKKYLEATEDYTKAIDCGYKNYDIYFDRATAYYCAEFYANAIDDFTKALTYKSTEEAYLYRGLAKFQKKDITCIEDLKKGGIKGQAIVREIESELSSAETTEDEDPQYDASGTGFVIDPKGYIATNYHVIEGAKGIDVYLTVNGKTTTYAATIVIVDKYNDLAILKIKDNRFNNLQPIPYSFGSGTKDVGTSVFAMGYPKLSYLGEELKVTDGIISSKTGYQGDITTYQITAPIQPGNSGGPLFDKEGFLVGITNAGVSELQNVGYAIKVSYLKNLIEACPETINIPLSNNVSKLSLIEKIKQLSPYVVIIKTHES